MGYGLLSLTWKTRRKKSSLQEGPILWSFFYKLEWNKNNNQSANSVLKEKVVVSSVLWNRQHSCNWWVFSKIFLGYSFRACLPVWKIQKTALSRKAIFYACCKINLYITSATVPHSLVYLWPAIKQVTPKRCINS